MKERLSAGPNLSQIMSVLGESGAYSHSPEANSLLRLQARLTVCIAGLSVVSVVLSCWENEEYHSAKDPGSTLIVALRTLQGALVLLQAVLLIRKEKVARKAAEILQKTYNCGLRLGIELLLICPTPIPFYNKTMQTRQLGQTMTIHLDDILVMVICLRLVLVIPVFAEFGLLAGQRARLHRDLHKVPTSLMFSIKGWMKQYSVLSVLTINIVNLLLGGFLIHDVERSIEEEGGEMSQVTNGFWIVEISERSIGYGDLGPRTHIGRGLVIICVLVGIVNMSSAVGLVCNSTQLSQKELRLATKVLVSKQESRQLRSAAASFLQSYWKLHFKRKSRETRLAQVQAFAAHLNNFRFKRTLWQAKSEPTLKERVLSFKSSSRLLWQRIAKLANDAKPCRKAAFALVKQMEQTTKALMLARKTSERTHNIFSAQSGVASPSPPSTFRAATATSPRKPTSLRRSSVTAYRNFQRRLFHSGSLSSVPEECPSPQSAYV